MTDWSSNSALWPLEIGRPYSSMAANDRWLHAYPGLPYNVRIHATGGVYPYLYEKVAGPSDMSVDPETGVINWTNPQSDATGCQVKVTDTKGTEVTSATWNITVATTRFRFVDAVDGNDSWDGTTPTFVSGTTGPWQTLGQFQDDGVTNTLGYFMSGTYNVYDGAGVVVTGGNSTRWGPSQDRPVIFMAYPGESPVFDHGYVEDVSEGLEFDFGNSGNPNHCIYFDGIEHTHAHNKCLRVNPTFNSYMVIRNGHFHHNGPGRDGSNSALGVAFESGAHGSGHHVNVFIESCEFNDYIPQFDFTPGNCCFKIYSTDRLLIEDCVFHDLDNQDQDEEAIANKAGNRELTVRGCYSYDMIVGTYGGNMNAAATGDCEFQLVFCYFQTDDHPTILINHDNNLLADSRIERCTFRGPVRMDELDADNGPILFDRNVIVNGDAATDNPNGTGITYNIAPTAPDQLTVTNYLFGPNDGSIIDSNGDLVNQGNVGLYGWEIPE